MPEIRKKYDREFREGAVRIVEETGKPIAQVARDLGVNEGTLGNWVAKAREAREGTEGLSAGDIEELKRLRAENAELRMERDVLGGPLGRRGDGPVAVAAFIAAQREQHQVPHATACRALGVSPAWFHKWRHGDPSPRHARRVALAAEIKRLFAK